MVGVRPPRSGGSAGGWERLRETPQLWLVGIIALLPVSELGISLRNQIITSQLPP